PAAGHLQPIDRIGAPILRRTLGDVVRSMNCYYSNLIEGHHTHPVDINRALNGDYAGEPEKRKLQREAVAHIEVQRHIDGGLVPFPAASKGFVLHAHRAFCGMLAEDLVWVEGPGSHERIAVVPGELRERLIRVGIHIAPSAEEIDGMLERFEAVYGTGQ